MTERESELIDRKDAKTVDFKMEYGKGRRGLHKLALKRLHQHTMDENMQLDTKRVREAALKFMEVVQMYCPLGRERSYSERAVEEALMWATKGIALQGTPVGEEAPETAPDIDPPPEPDIWEGDHWSAMEKVLESRKDLPRQEPEDGEDFVYLWEGENGTEFNHWYLCPEQGWVIRHLLYEGNRFLPRNITPTKTGVPKRYVRRRKLGAPEYHCGDES